MKIFKYTVHTYVPDSENMLNYNTKDICIINNNNLSENDIKKLIIEKQFNNDENCTVTELNEIKQY